MKNHDKRRGTARKTVLGLAVLASAMWWAAGCSGWGKDAKITNIAVSGLGSRDPIVWLSMEFMKYPEGGGDLKDVQVVFGSDVIQGRTTFDWKHLTAAPMRKVKGQLARQIVPGFSADKEPPLNTPFDVGFPLDARDEVGPDASFSLTADLYWAGKKQDSAEISLRHLFKKKK